MIELSSARQARMIGLLALLLSVFVNWYWELSLYTHGRPGGVLALLILKGCVAALMAVGAVFLLVNYRPRTCTILFFAVMFVGFVLSHWLGYCVHSRHTTNVMSIEGFFDSFGARAAEGWSIRVSGKAVNGVQGAGVYYFWFMEVLTTILIGLIVAFGCNERYQSSSDIRSIGIGDVPGWIGPLLFFVPVVAMFGFLIMTAIFSDSIDIVLRLGTTTAVVMHRLEWIRRSHLSC